MKRLRFITTVFFTLTILFVAGCVSISMQKNQARKSTKVDYEPPPYPFALIKTDHLDLAWRNSKTGSSISYLSECESSSDPTLKNIFQNIISDIENVEIIEESEVFYNSREAYHTLVQGKVDGVLTRFELMIFKKNNCTYILSYTSIAEAFALGQKDFQRFVRGFKVP